MTGWRCSQSSLLEDWRSTESPPQPGAALLPSGPAWQHGEEGEQPLCSCTRLKLLRL